MSEFLQQLINGLSLGSIYALIALGYTMVYGVLRFINFAHGDLFMIGAFAGMYMVRWLPESVAPWMRLVIVLAFAMFCCSTLGIVIEKLAYRPLRERSRLTVLITAIGVSLFLEYLGQAIFGATPQSFRLRVATGGINAIPGVAIGWIDLIVVSITVVLLVGLRFIVMRTRMGLAMRAVSVNPTAAALMGVNNDVVISFTFGVGSALAAAAGILYVIKYPSLDPFMGILPGTKAFVAAVLGGIGNIPGAALGGLLIGVVESLVKGYAGRYSALSEAVAFVILILVLLVKPAGLLGKVQREKV